MLLALFTFSNWAWGVFSLAIIIVAAWEWTRLSGMSRVNGNIFLAATLALSWLILMAYLRGPEALAEFNAYKLVALGVAAGRTYVHSKVAQIIVAAYAAMLVMGWPVALVAGLGLFDQWLGLRRRLATASPAE